MEVQFTSEDSKRIRRGIREKYRKVAINPDGLFSYPTGRAGLEVLGYDPIVLNSLPDEVSASYCGAGNPFSLGPINEGITVLDIGCGAGVDTILAAMMTGPSGKAVGVDIVPEMLQRAEENLKMTDLKNIIFKKASGEKLPFEDNSFDVVISNSVINLIPDKLGTLKESMRVLKPGGRLMIADQIMAGRLQKDIKARLASWFQWEGGAIPGMDFLELLQQIGFKDAELVAETGFNSSPKTKGVLILAKKPIESDQKTIKPIKDSLSDYSKSSKEVRGEGATMEDVLKKAYELGAEKAKIIGTETIVVEKWVRWKCLYGCPLYNKDPYHPPIAPDADETKQMLREYSKAVLLNGPKGKPLTETAVRLEGEAYNMGYYKAFAMTALTAGSGTTSNSGATWPSGESEGPCDLQEPGQAAQRVRPMMEACGIDVFKTARNNGFEIDTRKETFGRWNYFAMVLVEWSYQLEIELRLLLLLDDKVWLAMQDDTVKVLLFLAQGFEDLEAVAILDVFAWTHYRKHIQKASVTTAGFHETVTSRCGLSIKTDLQFSEITPEDYQAFVLPGGFHSQGFEEAYSSKIHRLAKEIHQNGGYIATMCVGVLPVADAGLLKGKKATTYPYSRNHDNVRRLKEGGAIATNKHVVIDDRIISCDGPGSSLDVAFLLMECLMGSETAREVRQYMIYEQSQEVQVWKRQLRTGIRLFSTVAL